MIVITQKRIYRSDLQKNPKSLFIFGDNMARVGYGGQAAECRDEPNAHGIATKVSTSEFMQDNNDEHMEAVASDIEALLEKLKSRKYNVVVFPEDGIGTGLAELDVRAPLLFATIKSYLDRIKKISEVING